MKYKVIGYVVAALIALLLFMLSAYVVFKAPDYLVRISDTTYYHKDTKIVYIRKGVNYDPLFDAVGNVVIWKEEK